MNAELCLEQFAVELDVAARKARDRMQTMKRRTLPTFADPVQHKKWLQEFLREMVGVIAEALGETSRPAGQRLYVWPGYDSILLDNARITFELSVGIRDKLETFGYHIGTAEPGVPRALQTGALFPQGRGTDRATVYYDATLAPLPEQDQGPGTFSTGGTHNWLALNPSVGSEPLLGFHVRTVEGAAESHDSFPTISLDRDQPLGWGDVIADVLNGACGDTPENFWPLPARFAGESSRNYADRRAEEYASAAHRSIRQRLYSLWLIGCFVGDPAAVLLNVRGSQWLQRLIDDLENVEPVRAARLHNLRELERVVANGGRELPLDDASFSSWSVVTIPYPIADSRSGEGDEPDELGSGMLLSNSEFPSFTYLMIRQWIAAYYLSLRQQESAVLRAEREAHKAALHAEREIRRQLSHAVGTELTYVSFLANSVEELVKEDQFVPRKDVLLAALRNARTEQPLTVTEFAGKHGHPKPIESALTNVALAATDIADRDERDAFLIEAALRKLPTAEAWKLVAALSENITSVIFENRALVRVDDPAVVGELRRPSRDEAGLHGTPIVSLLGRALVVALTVYFRKAFPPSNEQGEAVCLASATALFGHRKMDDEGRRKSARQCRDEWGTFLIRCYSDSRKRPTYAQVSAWIRDVFSNHSRLFFDIPDVDDNAVVSSAGGENAPIIVEAWLTEALMNVLKHTRPGPNGNAIVKVDWVRPRAELEVANSTTPEAAAVVESAVEAYSRGSSSVIEGHQGLAFLGYAAMHLFEGKQLTAAFDRATQMLRLVVA
jgi:hypothetical protein